MEKLVKLLGVAAVLTSGAKAAQKPISSDYVCQHPPYTVSIVSKSPMVLYLHDFITAEERIHLQDVTYDSYHQSRHETDKSSTMLTLTPEKIAFCTRESPEQQVNMQSTPCGRRNRPLWLGTT